MNVEVVVILTCAKVHSTTGFGSDMLNEQPDLSTIYLFCIIIFILYLCSLSVLSHWFPGSGLNVLHVAEENPDHFLVKVGDRRVPEELA